MDPANIPAPPPSRPFWANRWLRAAVVAVALGAWPVWHLVRTEHPAGLRARMDFVLSNADGTSVRLADFQGKAVLLNFWATWCPPCKAEIPSFVELADKYRSQNFIVLGVSVDDPPADIRKFAADYKVNYPLLVGNGHDDLLQAYEAADVIPISWLIRRDGTVLAKVQGIHTKEWFETQVKALVGDDDHF